MVLDTKHATSPGKKRRKTNAFHVKNYFSCNFHKIHSTSIPLLAVLVPIWNNDNEILLPPKKNMFSKLFNCGFTAFAASYRSFHGIFLFKWTKKRLPMPQIVVQQYWYTMLVPTKIVMLHGIVRMVER